MVDSSNQGRRQRSVSQPPALSTYGGDTYKKDKTRKGNIVNNPIDGYLGKRPRFYTLPPDTAGYYRSIFKKDKTMSITASKTAIINAPIGQPGKRKRAHTLPQSLDNFKTNPFSSQPQANGLPIKTTGKTTIITRCDIAIQPMKNTTTNDRVHLPSNQQPRFPLQQSTAVKTTNSAQPETETSTSSTTTETKTPFSPPSQRLSRPRSRTLPASLYETSLELTDITEPDRSREPHSFNHKSGLLPDHIQSDRTMKGGSVGQNFSGFMSKCLLTLTARKKQILRRTSSVASFQSNSINNNNKTLKQNEQAQTKEKIRATQSLPYTFDSHQSKLTNRRGNVISLKKGQMTYVSNAIGGGVRPYSESFELRNSSSVWLGS